MLCFALGCFRGPVLVLGAGQGGGASPGTGMKPRASAETSLALVFPLCPATGSVLEPSTSQRSIHGQPSVSSPVCTVSVVHQEARFQRPPGPDTYVVPYSIIFIIHIAISAIPGVSWEATWRSLWAARQPPQPLSSLCQS